MFKILIAIAFLVILSLSVRAQINQKGSAEVERKFAEIKKEYKRINGLQCTTKELKYKNSCGVLGANIIYYYHNNEIVKIIDKGIGDDDKAPANWNMEYYYKNNELIFVYERYIYFDVETMRNVTAELRDYFANNKLIYRIDEIGTKKYYEDEPIDELDRKYLLLKARNEADLKDVFYCEQ